MGLCVVVAGRTICVTFLTLAVDRSVAVAAVGEAAMVLVEIWGFAATDTVICLSDARFAFGVAGEADAGVFVVLVWTAVSTCAAQKEVPSHTR